MAMFKTKALLTSINDQMSQFTKFITRLALEMTQVRREVGTLRQELKEAQAREREFILQLVRISTANAIPQAAPKLPEAVRIDDYFEELPIGHKDGYRIDELMIVEGTIDGPSTEEAEPRVDELRQRIDPGVPPA